MHKLYFTYLLEYLSQNPSLKKELYLLAIYQPLHTLYYKSSQTKPNDEYQGMKILYEDTVFEMMKSLDHYKLKDEQELYQKFDGYVCKPKLKDRVKFDYGLKKENYDPNAHIYGMVFLMAENLID